MKYVIVHLIRGEAGEFHGGITRELTEKFGTYPLYERVPPHITLKRSFEREEKEIDGIYTLIDDCARVHTQSDYHLRGFGHFCGETIYIEAVPSREMIVAVTDLQNRVSGLDIALEQFDLNQNFHATVAMASHKAFSFDTVWGFLQSVEAPDFSMKFDNIAVLKKVDNRWLVDRVTELRV